MLQFGPLALRVGDAGVSGPGLAFNVWFFVGFMAAGPGDGTLFRECVPLCDVVVLGSSEDRHFFRWLFAAHVERL